MIPRLLLALTLLVLPSTAAAQSSTSFAQLAGATGCLVADGPFADDAEGCGKVPALASPDAVAVAPDGGQVYVASEHGGTDVAGTSGVTVLARDAGSGGVTFASCVSDDGGDGRAGSEGVCADGDALSSVSDLAFSSDGAFLYATSPGSSGVSWFARDKATGALAQRGCIKLIVRPGERCTQANALAGASAVAVSTDGGHVYVAAPRSGAVAVFGRDAATGALTPRSCASETGSDGACARAPGLTAASTVSPSADGKALYVLGAHAIATLAVDPGTGDLAPKGCLLAGAPAGGPCTDMPLLAGPVDAKLTPDGRNLLVLAGADDARALVSFTRDPDTGALAQQQCFQQAGGGSVTGGGDAQDSAGAGCDAASWEGAGALAISADGRGVFVGGSSSLGAYRRDPVTGRLSQFACLIDADTDPNESCGTARGVDLASGMAASPDARNLYVTTFGDSLTVLQVSVAIDARALRASAGGTARVRLACPAARTEGCAGRLTGAATAARFRLAPGRAGSVRVRLSRRQLRHRTLTLTARMQTVASSRRVRVQFHGSAARRSQ